MLDCFYLDLVDRRMVSTWFPNLNNFLGHPVLYMGCLFTLNKHVVGRNRTSREVVAGRVPVVFQSTNLEGLWWYNKTIRRFGPDIAIFLLHSYSHYFAFTHFISHYLQNLQCMEFLKIIKSLLSDGCNGYIPHIAISK